MKLSNLYRLISLALAFVFCCGMVIIPNDVSEKVSAQNVSSGYVVRVGMYAPTTTDTRLFSAKTDSASGFDIGFSNGASFSKLFELNNSSVIILPMVNVDFQNGNCTPDENGNISVYSQVVSTHGSFGEAVSKANQAGGFVSVVSGGYEVRKSVDKSVIGAKAPANGGLMVLSLDGKILFTYEDSSKKLALRGKNGGSVAFPMVHRTGVVNTYDYMGFFEYSVSEGKLFMVNCIGIEDYTKCIMANEIGTNVSTETRKAFAVLARTVPMGKKHANKGFDVCCNSACCQVYKGLHQMSAENNAIVDATKGLYCAYQGAPITVLYHNSNGGASCSSVAAWGGNDIPYLTTVFLDEAGESDVWQMEFSKQEFYEYLTSRYSFAGLEDDEITMQILETDPHGSEYITVLSVSDGSGNNFEIRTSEDIRSACGFNSANFKLSYSSDVLVLNSQGVTEKKAVSGVLTADGYKEFSGFGESYKSVCGLTVAPDKVVIDGEGAGHGVGFSAVGSEKLAADGYSYEYILQFFFNGTELRSAS